MLKNISDKNIEILMTSARADKITGTGMFKIYKEICNSEKAKRMRIKEQKEKDIKKQNLIDKLNKTRYSKENKKDFYYLFY